MATGYCVLSSWPMDFYPVILVFPLSPEWALGYSCNSLGVLAGRFTFRDRGRGYHFGRREEGSLMGAILS